MDIERKKGVEDPDSASALKREGLQALQALSGEHWTDYNLHDPGVTILEQLCYALTDLIYRASFGPADILSDSSGSIDFNKQALYPPEEIFPSQAITTDDYRKIIFDRIPEVDNVWIRSEGKPADSPQGQYIIYVKLIEDLETHDRKIKHAEVVEKVKNVYAANRNLCEDLKGVSIVPPRYYSLHGAIEIIDANALPEVLAALYFISAKILSPGIPFHSYDNALRAKNLESLFTGPLTEHVYIEEDAFDEIRASITIADMISAILQIEGVYFVDSLWFEDDQGNKTDTISFDASLAFVPCLKIPELEEEVGVQLIKNGRAYRVSIKETRTEYMRRCADEQTLRKAQPHLSEMISKPTGEAQGFSEYYSIQHHFPAIYGINAYGVPESDPEDRKGQAKQLKTYLLPFEQIMANFLKNLEEIPTLFSIDPQLKQSYFSQVLDNKSVPNIEGLYRGPLDQVTKVLARIVKQYDNYFDRRDRVLDYLLGLYGETFKQHSLRHFNDYEDAATLEHQEIRNKMNLLKHLVEISRNRAGAFNYREVSWNTENTAALKKKVSLLLNIRYAHNRSVIDNFIEKGLVLLTDDRYKSVKEGTVALEYVDLGDIQDRIDQQFRPIPLRDITSPDEGELFEKIVFLKHNSISGSILRKGIHLDRYRLGRTGEGDRFQLVFKPGEDDRWEYLGSFSSVDETVSVANDLRLFLIQLNIESEGLHLLEHLLLKSLGKAEHDGVPEDFYPFRMSVLLPAWTSRFYDKAFRLLLEETLRLNAPAHIYLEFYWLDFHRMDAFEVLYKKWIDQKWKVQETGSEEDIESLDRVSKSLIDFLMSQGTE